MGKELGARIAATRTARRMTQRQLADAAAVSLSLLRKIEQGSWPVTDPALDALAAALGLPVDVLAGRRPLTDSRVHLAIPSLRRAIDAYDLPDDGPVRALGDLREVVQAMTAQRLAAGYTAIAETAPPVLGELSRALHTFTGDEAQRAAGLLMIAYRSADAVAYKCGYHDLSARLVELMRWSAARAREPLLAATAAYVRTETFFASGNLRPAMIALEHAMGALTPVTTAECAALGALHMRAAVVSARLAGALSAVDGHLREARRLAGQVPEGTYAGTAFGPASVHVHEVSVAVELGDAARAVRAAERQVPLDELPAERRSHYWIEVARAQLWLGRRDQAFGSLCEARRIAPQHVREHPYVREALVTLLRLSVTPPQQLIAFAEWSRAI